MPSKTKLLFIVNKLSVGGAEKHTICLINGLDEDHFECSIALLKPNFDLSSEIDSSKLRKQISLDVNSRFDRKSMRRLAQYIDEAEIDVIVSVDLYPMVYAYFSERMASRRACRVVVLHQTDLANRYERFKMYFYRHLFRRFEQTIFVSKAQQQQWVEREGLAVNDPLAILNGIDVEHFSPSAIAQSSRPPELAFPDGALIVGICAGLRPHKRHVDLVQAIARVRELGTPAELVIIGDGTERANIEQCAAELQIAEHVHITGLQSDVRPYISLCHCMVIASVAVETFSLAVLESMAMEKPVIATRLGGIEEQLQHGVTGFVYERGDNEALAQHIIQLADARMRHEMGVRARQKVVSDFTVQGMLDAYAETFQALARRGGS